MFTTVNVKIERPSARWVKRKWNKKTKTKREIKNKINCLVCWCIYNWIQCARKTHTHRQHHVILFFFYFIFLQYFSITRSNRVQFTCVIFVQPKQRLLRRQKSASELESRYGLPECDDEKSKYHSHNIIHEYLWYYLILVSLIQLSHEIYTIDWHGCEKETFFLYLYLIFFSLPEQVYFWCYFSSFHLMTFILFHLHVLSCLEYPTQVIQSEAK